MAEVTVTIPDPVFEIIKKRAETTKSTPEVLVMVCAILCYSPAQYDSSKWLKFRDPESTDMTAAW